MFLSQHLLSRLHHLHLHLLPAGENDWWLSNQMQKYSPTHLFSSDPIDGSANLLTLRVDPHRVFDERHRSQAWGREWGRRQGGGHRA
ncbi:hypothetical protein N657DRAFT_649714 [Parathielavia appendiculata]|uniref:Uncharacterized protein n=1 Tax=Parathielavia appendiculata TaxID=2587402 RepID=A0AAN6Z030_9PEZI|nr:hypothetical protein N657DRAFT_649714 [Parathielavia appendiculata]